jgi:hypothetical protein
VQRLRHIISICSIKIFGLHLALSVVYSLHRVCDIGSLVQQKHTPRIARILAASRRSSFYGRSSGTDLAAASIRSVTTVLIHYQHLNAMGPSAIPRQARQSNGFQHAVNPKVSMTAQTSFLLRLQMLKAAQLLHAFLHIRRHASDDETFSLRRRNVIKSTSMAVTRTAV